MRGAMNILPVEKAQLHKKQPCGGKKVLPAAGLYSGTYKLPGSRDLLCDDILFSPSALTDGSGISRDDSCHQYKSIINRRAQR